MSLPSRSAWIFGISNAFIMLLLCWFWLSLPRTFGDETFLIKWTSLVKKALLGQDDKPAEEDVLYIDISGSKQLIPINDPLYEEPTGYQNAVISDRVHLATFLQKVHEVGENIPLIIIDLSFEYATAHDSLLQATLDQLQTPVIGAVRQLTDSTQSEFRIQLPLGIASYRTADGNFMKYPMLIQDTLLSLPLLAYSKVSEQQVYKKWWGIQVGQRACFANPIIDFKIRPIHISDGRTHLERPYDLRSIGTLLFEWEFWDEADIRDLLSGKTIIIGDFKYDSHETVFGAISGPLIVHNAYLTLQAGEAFVDWRWILLLFGWFLYMSLRVYREEEAVFRSRWWQMSDTALGRLIADSIDDTVYLAVLSVLSYFLFNVHINILVMLIYLKIITYCLDRFYFKTRRALTKEEE